MAERKAKFRSSTSQFSNDSRRGTWSCGPTNSVTSAAHFEPAIEPRSVAAYGILPNLRTNSATRDLLFGSDSQGISGQIQRLFAALYLLEELGSSASVWPSCAATGSGVLRLEAAPMWDEASGDPIVPEVRSAWRGPLAVAREVLGCTFTSAQLGSRTRNRQSLSTYAGAVRGCQMKANRMLGKTNIPARWGVQKLPGMNESANEKGGIVLSPRIAS